MAQQQWQLVSFPLCAWLFPSAELRAPTIAALLPPTAGFPAHLVLWMWFSIF